jgi:hypothetical protein
MEATSLHPLDVELVSAYVDALNADDINTTHPLLAEPWSAHVVQTARRGYRRAQAGDETGTHAVTYGLAQLLAQRYPTFFQEGLSLTAWEARFDRGAGIMLRPPSRMFIEAGLDISASRRMPIRLDFNTSMMGGAFIPARLVPQLETRLDTHLDRVVRRLVEAELDGVAVMGLTLEAVRYAREHRLGLYEAEDVIVPGEPGSVPPGARIVYANRKHLDPELRKRLEHAAQPPKKPGLIARLRGKGVMGDG